MPKNHQLAYLLILALTLQFIHAQQQQAIPQLTSDSQYSLEKSQLQTVRQDINNFKTTFESNLQEEFNRMKQLQDQTKKSMEKLQEIDKQLKSYSSFLQKINNIIHSFNTFLSQFNDKATTVMTRVVGFEQELKAIVSIDTLIVCILSLILVKILKDQFIEEGYQPVGSLSQHQPINANSAVNTTLTEREIEG